MEKMIETASTNDKNALRELAKAYVEVANSEEMAERKQLWRDLHDLKPERPMILFEPFSLDGFLSDHQFKCKEPELFNVEKKLMFALKQYEQIGDDIVLEPYFRMAWSGEDLTVIGKNFGKIKIIEHGAKTDSLAFASNFPIKTPDDIKKLTPRTFKIDRKPVISMKNRLEDIFGDILPIKLENCDNFVSIIGDQHFTGNNFIGLTWDVFKLIGAENMMFWAYDHPEAVHELCKFLVDDKKRFYQFLLDEKLLSFNTDNQFGGPSSYGYVSKLPACETDKKVELKDLWVFADSQESEPFSPDMFKEFFLPYIAEIANSFGLSYYGCCEKIDDRFEYIEKEIHNIRTVSVSGWSNLSKMGELLDSKYVYSRKPVPAFVSGPEPYWDHVEKEAIQTKKATKNCNLEIIFRDIYSSNCTTSRAAELVKKWRRIIGI